MDKEIKFICKAVKWFDKVNGNTYHSVRITRCQDNKTIVSKYGWTYGYGDHYKQTALETMFENGWLNNYIRKHKPIKEIPVNERHYTKETLYLFEQENNYPIYWDCSKGIKKEMIANSRE